MRSIITITFLFLFTACGGGGGESSSGGSPSGSNNETLASEVWGGAYSTGYYSAHGIVLHLQRGATTLTGTFKTGQGGTGTINGSINGSAVTFTLTETTCSGSYTGTGTIANDTITYTYSGHDNCYGSKSNEQGIISKLDASLGDVGLSGNWGEEFDSTTIIHVALKTTDNVNYTGKLKLFDWTSNNGSNYFKVTTADLSGAIGFGTHTDSCGASYDDWMLLSMSNINGTYSGGGVHLFSGATLDLRQWCLTEMGGYRNMTFGNGFQKII